MCDESHEQQGKGNETSPVFGSVPPVNSGKDGTTVSEPSRVSEPNSDERIWALLAHLCVLVLAIIGPGVILATHEAILKKESPFVKHHATQALFFQVAAVVGSIVITLGTCGYGLPVYLAFMVFGIMAALDAQKGKWYCYPFMSGLTENL
ncbi:MAG: DUF4870 domain-containing protein [Planctomycetota bacterium]